jgi:magnesium chelatase subunit I
MLVFTANPEDYTARGKIITPLKDRIGSRSARTIPATRRARHGDHAQEAWTERDGGAPGRVPDFVARGRRGVAFQARRIAHRQALRRQPAHADHVLENVVSNAERRALAPARREVVPRVTDIYAALPAITGKFELEYEGELRVEQKPPFGKGPSGPGAGPNLFT